MLNSMKLVSQTVKESRFKADALDFTERPPPPPVLCSYNLCTWEGVQTVQIAYMQMLSSKIHTLQYSMD